MDHPKQLIRLQYDRKTLPDPERLVYLKYDGISRWNGYTDAEFTDPDLGKRYSFQREQIKEALELGRTQGYELPLFQLADHQLRYAERAANWREATSMMTDIGGGISLRVLGVALVFGAIVKGVAYFENQTVADTFGDTARTVPVAGTTYKVNLAQETAASGDPSSYGTYWDFSKKHHLFCEVTPARPAKRNFVWRHLGSDFDRSCTDMVKFAPGHPAAQGEVPAYAALLTAKDPAKPAPSLKEVREALAGKRKFDALAR
jgi:hypothetical protein